MAEYIEREKVMDALLHEQYGYLCEDAINAIPAADVQEVKRGKWICDGYWSHGCGMGEEYGNYWKCSVCDKIVQEDYAKCGFHYCPYCGADMRGERT